MSLPLHARGASVALLDDPETTEGISDVDLSFRSRNDEDYGKHTKWITIPFRQICYVTLILVGLAAVVFAIFGSIVGVNAYRRLVFPHRAVHASPASLSDGSRIVTPYFAPAAKGGVAEQGKLVIKVWYREGVPLPPLTRPSEGNEKIHQYWYLRNQREQQEAAGRRAGEQGFIIPEIEETNEWIEVWTGELGEMDIESTRSEVARVTLPGHVVHSLVTNAQSRLVATFALLPSHSPSALSTYTHDSTRPVALYGPTQPWPLPFSSMAPPLSPAPLNAFIEHSSAGHSLGIRVRDWRPHMSSNGMLVAVPITDDDDELHLTFLATRTWVTMASDYPVYGLDGFKSAMSALQAFKHTCATQPWFMSDCYRTFARDGHFENLLLAEEQDEESKWMYGPFLTTRLSPTAPKDYVQLPTESELKALMPTEVKDFTFDWHVTYSSVSPAKLALMKLSNGPNPWGLLGMDSRAAKMHDDQELYSALFGLTFNPESRPITRGAVGAISVALRYLAIPFILHYWATRRISTGISIVTLTIQSITDLVYHIVTSALNFEDVSTFLFVMTIITFILLILKQIHLYLKPEFRLTRVGIVGIPLTVPLPTALRFRSASVSEKASLNLDSRFDWRIRIVIAVMTFLILRFAPAPPPIVSAPQYPDVVQGFGGATHYNPKVLQVMHIFNIYQSSVWLTSRLSQIHLNYRHKTFGGSHRITAYLLFGSLVLSHITKIFIRWFGRSQVMQPFTAWDVVTLVASAVVVVQAISSPTVDQDENNALD